MAVLFSSKPCGTALGKGEFGVWDNGCDHPPRCIEQGAAPVSVLVGMPMSELQQANTGPSGPIRRMTGGPKKSAVVIENHALIERNWNGHRKPGQNEASSLSKERWEVGAKGRGRAEW